MAIEVTVNSNKDKIIEETKLSMQAALEECGLIAEGYAKMLCPVDTGRLRNSITHEIQEFASYGVAYVGTNVEYAPYVELGTTRQRPQPFIKPSVADHEQEYLGIMEILFADCR